MYFVKSESSLDSERREIRFVGLSKYIASKSFSEDSVRNTNYIFSKLLRNRIL